MLSNDSLDRKKASTERTLMLASYFTPSCTRRVRRNGYAVLMAAGATLLPIVSSTSAATKIWNGADGAFWSNSGTWSPAVVPVNGDDVVIGTLGVSGSSPTGLFTSTYGGGGLKSLVINATAVNIFTLSQSLSGSAMIATNEVIGDTVNGNVYTQNGGSNTATQIILGNQSSGAGTYNLSGPSTVTLNTNGLYVGNFGQGNMTQSGGTVNITGNNGLMSIGGGNSLLVSTYTLSGGTIAFANGNYFGLGTRANFLQNGGAITFAGPNGLYVNNAVLSNAANLYTLSSGSITGQGFEVIGTSAGGGAVFNQSGGANTFGASGTLLLGSGGIGTYRLTGGTLFGVTETIGDTAGSTGNFVQSGGNNSLAGAALLTVGKSAGSVGNYTMDNSLGSSTLTTQEEDIGLYGSGVFTQIAGTHSANQILLAINTGSQANYTVAGGTLNVVNGGFISVGAGGNAAVFNQTGGTVTVAVNGGIYVATSSPGTYLMRGGSLSTDSLFVGAGATGSFNQTGGSVSVTNSAASLLYVGYFSNGTYNLDTSDSTSTLTASIEVIGAFGIGTFNQHSGSSNNAITSLQVGSTTGQGTLTCMAER